MSRSEKRARHFEAVRLFTEREFDLLTLFDRVAEAAGVFTSKIVEVRNDSGVMTQGHIAYRPVPVRIGGSTSSLVLTEDFRRADQAFSDSLILPQAPEVPLGETRKVRMGLEAYPGMPDAIRDATEARPLAYRRPRLEITSDEVGEVIDRCMFPGSISVNRLPSAQFEQVAFAHLLGDAAAELGIEMSS